jgi:predicted dithiol-disulfide oxidoreductase (DUF899 family)
MTMKTPPIVSPQEWEAAREQLLVKEKALTHARDAPLWHGTNVFFRDGDRVFRTYFINNRGDEAMGGTWSYLDVTPLGRQEIWEDSPQGYPQTPPYKWWNWHDAYAAEDSLR